MLTSISPSIHDLSQQDFIHMCTLPIYTCHTPHIIVIVEKGEGSVCFVEIIHFIGVYIYSCFSLSNTKDKNEEQI